VVVTLFLLFFQKSRAELCEGRSAGAGGLRQDSALGVLEQKIRMPLLRRGASHSARHRMQQIDTPGAPFRRASVRRSAFALLHRVVDPPLPSYGVVDPPSPCCGAVEGLATTMPARKNVSAADSRQKGQNACSMNAWT